MKRLGIVLALALIAGTIAACGGSTSTASTTARTTVAETAAEAEMETEPLPADKLSKISNDFVTGYWNDVFCDISHYVGRGTNSVGGDLDLEYTLRKLNNYTEDRDESDNYIRGLDGAEYGEIKYIWGKIITEMDNMHSRISEETPRPNDSTYEFSAGNFSTYSSDFKKEINKLK